MKKYPINVTYEVWDEEALNAGDTDDRGFELEDEMMDVQDIVRYIGNNGFIHPSSSSFDGIGGLNIIWWESEEQDYRTGDHKNTCIHLDNIPDEVVFEILVRTGRIDDLSGWNKSLTPVLKKVFEELEDYKIMEESEPDYPEFLKGEK
jgi:hypothetical protein